MLVWYLRQLLSEDYQRNLGSELCGKICQLAVVARICPKILEGENTGPESMTHTRFVSVLF